jgi:peptidoglycan/xylan/chitin deacetylase (PgdA/CDA1 family)
MPSPTEAALAATAAVAAATGLTLTYAGLSPTSQLFGHTILAGNDPTEAALTYDDGPNDVATDALLDLLARHNARATFFMIGRFVRQRPEIVRRVHAATPPEPTSSSTTAISRASALTAPPPSRPPPPSSKPSPAKASALSPWTPGPDLALHHPAPQGTRIHALVTANRIRPLKRLISMQKCAHSFPHLISIWAI